MIYVPLLGGIGNQLFQIATALSLAIDNNDEVLTSEWCQSITERKEKEVIWYKTILKSIKKINHIELRKYRPIFYFKEKGFLYNPITYKPNMQISGYFQSAKYFDHNRDKIVEIFTQYKKEIQEHLDYKYQQIKSNKTISMHVRRTDYIKYQHYHVVQDENYYISALKKLGEKLGYETISELNKDYRIVIFSDDIEYCKKNNFFNSLDIYFVNDDDISGLTDLYLMSMCNHNIIANSSFSWWGSYLNKNKDKVVVAPSKWFNPSGGCKNWYTVYTKDMIVV